METKRRFNTRYLASGGILAAVAVVLMFIETPMPMLPNFLKLDISNIPALVGGFAFGPLVGVLIVLVKDLIHMTLTSTAFVGELADFLISGSFIFVSTLVYSYRKSRKQAFIGMGLGILAMVVVGALMNYYVLLPFYAKAYMPMEQIISLCSQINPRIVDKLTYVIYGVIPFNIIKGLVISVTTAFVYKNISKIIHG